MPIVNIPPSGGGGGAVDSVNGQTGVVVITKSDVGLGNVDNTSDANKPVSTATQTALNLKEVLANKAIDFSTVNDILYPTTKAINDLIRDNFPMQTSLMFLDQDSDISGYKKSLSTASIGGNQNYTRGSANDGDIMQLFATDLNTPSIIYIPEGFANARMTARVSSGTKTAKLYAEVYKRTVGNVETLLYTSSDGPAITGVATSCRMDITIAVPLALAPDERLITKVRVHVTGAGTAPTIVISIAGTTNAALNMSLVTAPAAWGQIAGTLTSQTDLNTALTDLQTNIDLKANKSGDEITGRWKMSDGSSGSPSVSWINNHGDGLYRFTDEVYIYTVRDNNILMLGRFGVGIGLDPNSDTSEGLDVGSSTQVKFRALPNGYLRTDADGIVTIGDLSGIVFDNIDPVVSGDNIITATGKLQAQITDLQAQIDALP